ncbi:MAG TPA: serine hydrolase domain-containing protein [Thermoanaerobaculia bacterium]|nr:serine hydrolase domain-containing protein [Thermoanaerobaculia bacterium]
MRGVRLAFLLALFAHAAAAQLSPQKIAGIDRLVKSFMAANAVPGASVSVVVDGKLAWSNGYGVADVENSVPATATTMYRTASIGKTMTATAAMILADEGKLDLNADIREYCPAFPQKQWRITPWNLLTHTSGIRHYGGPHDQEEQFSTFHYANITDALAPFKNDPLQFEPGTKWQYSTYGYDVLACVIEGASHTPFLTFMKTRVWQPAGMSLTRDDDPSAIVPNRAAKYTRKAGQVQNAPMIDMSNRMGAGGFLTTVIDLGHFFEALYAGRLVKPETLQRMMTPAKLSNGEAIGYGLGWGVEVDEWKNDRWTFHGGSSPGASGIVALMPGHRFAVAVLTNLDELPNRGELAEDIARLVLDFEPRK